MANRPNKKFKKIIDDYMPIGEQQYLDLKLEESGLSEDSVKKLQTVELFTICDVAKCQMRQLYRIPNINKKNIFEVLRKLQSYNMDFRQPPNRIANIEEDGAENLDEVRETVVEAQHLNKQQNNISQKTNLNNIKNPNFDNNKHGNVSIEKESKNVSANQLNVNRNEKLPFKKIKQDYEKKDNKVDNKLPQNKNQVNNLPSNMKKQESAPVIRERINTRDFEKNSRRDRDNKKEEEKKLVKPNIKKPIELPPLKNADGLYKFYKQGKWGYKDESGKVVIQPTYDEAYNFSEGFACVELNERVGFINKEGEVIIPIIYDTACSFSEGLASVTKSDKCAYINSQGEFAFGFDYEAATSFINGISLVKKEGKWGYMNRQTGEIRLR